MAIGFVTPAKKAPKRQADRSMSSSRPSPGSSTRTGLADADDPLLELAWAVTVHKSQGSEFGTTFLILPARANVSRELMYTALTRQRDKVVILHEGTLADLRDLAQPWRSETARRLTDLFDTPQPVTLEIRGTARRYDRKLMHVSANGIPMASKNEVIIAGLLDQLDPWALAVRGAARPAPTGASSSRTSPSRPATGAQSTGSTRACSTCPTTPGNGNSRRPGTPKTASSRTTKAAARNGLALCGPTTSTALTREAWLNLASEVLQVIPAARPAQSGGQPGPTRRIARRTAQRPNS